MDYIVTTAPDLKRQYYTLRERAYASSQSLDFRCSIKKQDEESPFVLIVDEDGKVRGGARIDISCPGSRVLRAEIKIGTYIEDIIPNIQYLKRAELKHLVLDKELRGGFVGASHLSRLGAKALKYCESENSDVLILLARPDEGYSNLLDKLCSNHGSAKAFCFGEFPVQSGQEIVYKELHMISLTLGLTSGLNNRLKEKTSMIR